MPQRKSGKGSTSNAYRSKDFSDKAKQPCLVSPVPGEMTGILKLPQLISQDRQRA